MNIEKPRAGQPHARIDGGGLADAAAARREGRKQIGWAQRRSNLLSCFNLLPSSRQIRPFTGCSEFLADNPKRNLLPVADVLAAYRAVCKVLALTERSQYFPLLGTQPPSDGFG
jgi:hypothetical protein